MRWNVRFSVGGVLRCNLGRRLPFLSAAACLVVAVEEFLAAVGYSEALEPPSRLAPHSLWRTCIGYTPYHTVPEGALLRQRPPRCSGLGSALGHRRSVAAHRTGMRLHPPGTRPWACRPLAARAGFFGETEKFWALVLSPWSLERT